MQSCSWRTRFLCVHPPFVYARCWMPFEIRSKRRISLLSPPSGSAIQSLARGCRFQAYRAPPPKMRLPHSSFQAAPSEQLAVLRNISPPLVMLCDASRWQFSDCVRVNLMSETELRLRDIVWRDNGSMHKTQKFQCIATHGIMQDWIGMNSTSLVLLTL